MGYVEGTTSVQVWDGDRDWINTRAAQLTKDGPGKFGQRETIRWLIDQHERAVQILLDQARGEAAS